MITKISINNIASFKQSVDLETDKKVNLIYGLNGTGKTTITNYLRDTDNAEYSDCSIKGLQASEQEIVVYNKNFIDDNFFETDVQKGIFTLTKDNKEALEKINVAKETKNTLNSELEKLKSKLKEHESEIEENKQKTIDKCWSIKTEYTGGDRVFDNAGFLDGLKGNKEHLFNHLIELPISEPQRTLEEIKRELTELGEATSERELLKQINYTNQTLTLEQNSIFQEVIIGNENSSVASLIQALGNSDWVKEGLSFVDMGQRANCPFCQEETMSQKLVDEIKGYFDTTYENKIKELQTLEEQYKNVAEFKIDDYNRDYFSKEQGLKIENLFSNLKKTMQKNLNSIKTKITSPSQKITLDSSDEKISAINEYIQTLNEEIQAFNNKIRNREQTIENLRKEFWALQRNNYNNDIVQYLNIVKKLNNDIDTINNGINTLNNKINDQDSIISESQKKVSNIDQTINNINNHLHNFGIQDFSIAKHEEQENTFVLQRSQGDESIFKSLSEGEKTVISFLYFYELCRGRTVESNINKDKIIVIDDPISSLSHTHVFNIATLIKNDINQENSNFLQFFVFTHNLYFFHELVDKKSFQNGNNGYQKLFRITKNNYSHIQEMNPSEIQNEYQSYWAIIKDPDKSNKFIVANAMRNIIEYFFGFIEKQESLNNIFQKNELSDNKFKSFQRYIDRESHSDSINIYDFKDFDDGVFKEALELVFKECGFEEHYKKMMNK